ncbi:PP2C family protein-serine/threonine phosphatase [Cryptosporangium arvum]|uniref:PP2C family protein-serine/threonine phosphatase n=1 Tax=Cryptosporangium arvum TaxID=80871 RepID=UPI0004B8A843|nr:PP2C family protein-serine/threonine phosphatase [Cryptosporangium arvum]
MGDLGEEMFDGLLHGSHRCHPEDLIDLVATHATPVGLHDPQLYLADLQQVNLVRVPRGRVGTPVRPVERIPIDTTSVGRVFRRTGVQYVPAGGDRTHVWLPLLEGAERLGVLRLTVEGRDRDHVDPVIKRRARRLASLVGLLVVTKRAYSDTLVGLTRHNDMTLSAEMQWGLLPPLTFATDRIVVAGALEPAYKVAGDTFDYGVIDDGVHLALFDAAGHDLNSAVVVGLAAAAYRQGRRQSLGLRELGDAIDEKVAARFGPPELVTGVLAHFDAGSGKLEWVLRGHPPPVLIRDGKWVKTLWLKPGLPMGIGLRRPTELGSVQLEPGDRLLFYTDGVTEARDADGNEFGLDRLVDFVIKREADALPATEALRRLIRSILDHQHGHLQDDATVLLVEWGG